IQIVVEVCNLSSDSVWVVGVVDGSEEGLRYPHYRPHIALGGSVVAGPPPAEDPLCGPLRLSHFRLLAPGEAFNPTQSPDAGYLPLSTFSTFRPPVPGRYEYTLCLSTESQSPEEWLGRFGQKAQRAAVLERVAQVPRLTTHSNRLTVEVV